MTYVMSDIHGDYERYMKMLEAINLDEDRDTLYVLGDVIDFGDAGMKILDDMSSRPNVSPILGEHEYAALPVLRRVTAKPKNVQGRVLPCTFRVRWGFPGLALRRVSYAGRGPGSGCAAARGRGPGAGCRRHSPGRGSAAGCAGRRLRLP